MSGNATVATPEELRARVMGISDRAERAAFLTEFFGQFDRAGFTTALEFVAALDVKEHSDAALLALTRSLGGRTDLQIFRDAAAAGSGGLSPAALLARYLNEGNRDDVIRAATLANSFTTGAERARLLGESAQRLVRSDPAAARSLGAELSGSDLTLFATRLARAWSGADPSAAREWAERLPPGPERDGAWAGVTAAEAERDVGAAARNLSRLPPGEARVNALESVGRSWALRDTSAALAWANSLPDPTERERARQAIGEVAPSGIGARIAVDAFGYPTMASLLPGGPASASGSIRAGDRITAIQDGTGGWVDARDMPMTDVVNRLRGTPGSPVTMQIAAPDGEPRTVTIYRRQITHGRGN